MRNGKVANIVKVELIIPVVVFGRMLIWVFVQVAIFLNNIDKNKEFTRRRNPQIFKGTRRIFEGILLLVDASCIWSSAYHSG